MCETGARLESAYAELLRLGRRAVGFLIRDRRRPGSLQTEARWRRRALTSPTSTRVEAARCA